MNFSLDIKFKKYENLIQNIAIDFCDAFTDIFNNEIEYINITNDFYGNKNLFIHIQLHIKYEVNVNKFLLSRLDWSICSNNYIKLHCKYIEGNTNNVSLLINIKNLDDLNALYRYRKIHNLCKKM